MKKLMQHILENKSEIDNQDDISQFYPDENLDKITIDTWINEFQIGENFITIDARSESEYEIDNLPNAINFPILNDLERKEVGFLYKNFSPQSALFRANEHAEKKMELIENFTKDLIKTEKNIYVYCWRGGKRSSALVHFMKNFNANPIKIISGYKAYRNKVYEQFYVNPTELRLVPLTGLTGCGKTEIIEQLTGRIPVFDIEKAASHASSLFGKIRYDLTHSKNITTQAGFENSLYTQLITPSKESDLPYLTEGESKRINRFSIPGQLFDCLIKSPSIKIHSSINKRVERIVNEYFIEDGPEKVHTIVETSNFLKQILGKEKKKYLLKLIEEQRYEEFSKWFLVEYYDKRYASKYQNTIAEVNSDNLESAKAEILAILKNRNHSMFK